LKAVRIQTFRDKKGQIVETIFQVAHLVA
jgi:hypothetical protein